MSFGIVTGAELNTVHTSNEVTVSGLGDGCTESISGTSIPEGESSRSFSINGGPFGLSDATVRNGDRLRLRLISPSIYGSTNWWYALGARAFRVGSRPGSATNAPIITIVEPVDQATVSARNIVVSGTATDPDGVTSVVAHILGGPFNGYQASSTNGFATWQAEIPLLTGSNVVTVSSSDSLNNQNPVAAEISITNLLTVLEQPSAIESDTANLRLLVVDDSHRALIAIDLVSGQTTVLSDENTPNAENIFVTPAKLVVNSSGSTAWLLDRGYDDIVQIDLATGVRTLLIDSVASASPMSLADATDLVLDESNSRLLLVKGEEETTQVISLSLSSGERVVLSDAATPDSAVPFGVPMSLALDTIGNRLLVMQRNLADPARSGNALLAIDSTSGQRELVIDDSILIDRPVDADIDINRGLVLILSEYYGNEIWAFDLASNELTKLFVSIYPSTDQIARDPLENRLFMLDRPIRAIHLETGEVSVAF
jgi:hypothetical protein